MCILTACTAGFLLDQLLGDPAWIYHPIRMIGYRSPGSRKNCIGRAVLPGRLEEEERCSGF